MPRTELLPADNGREQLRQRDAPLMDAMRRTGDHPDREGWIRRVQELGVGTAPIPRKKLGVENLAAAIRAATTDRDLEANARALGEKIRAEDSLAEAVK